MKILALIVQNKKGVNVFVVSSSNFTARLALHYSRSLYDFIIKQFSKLLLNLNNRFPYFNEIQNLEKKSKGLFSLTVQSRAFVTLLKRYAPSSSSSKLLQRL